MPPSPSACAQMLWEETRRGRNNMIGAGGGNFICSTSFNGIFSGENNQIFNASNDSFIGAGCGNVIGGAGWQCMSFIGAGAENVIDGGTYGVIGGGLNNRVTQPFSAVLGGRNNTVNHTCSGIFGDGLTSAAANTFHVNCLNAVNTPVYTGIPYPLGTVIRHALPAPALGLPAGTTILIIQ